VGLWIRHFILVYNQQLDCKYVVRFLRRTVKGSKVMDFENNWFDIEVWVRKKVIISGCDTQEP